MNTIYTPLVTTNVAIAVFIGILLIALIIANVCDPLTFKASRARIFLGVLFSLGLVITFLFYYALVNLQASQYRSNVLSLTSNINQILTKGVIDELHVASKHIPNFTLSLFPLTSCSCDKTDDDTPENTLLKFKISYKIFSLWQELLLSHNLIDLDREAYLCIFLQKAHSKELHAIWNNTKLDFNCTTQEFGNLLFTYASYIKEQTPDNYIMAAKNIQKDGCFKKLFA